MTLATHLASPIMRRPVVELTLLAAVVNHAALHATFASRIGAPGADLGRHLGEQMTMVDGNDVAKTLANLQGNLKKKSSLDMLHTNLLLINLN